MWQKRFLERTNDCMGHVYLSIVFTWDLPQAYQRAVWLAMEGYEVYAGGPAVKLMPEYMRDVAKYGNDLPGMLQAHNPWATRTTVGCPNKCPFCAVPIVEGDFQELETWSPRPIVCDNNLTAASRAHFDRVVDSLKPYDSEWRKARKRNRWRKRRKMAPVWEIPQIDFNQGLDCRRLDKHHADRLGELDCMVRLAWDTLAEERAFFKAYETLIFAGFRPEQIHVYVLIGYNDTPDEARYRLEAVTKTGSWPNPMRFQPLDALTKNSYVGDGWTERELRLYMKYWSRLLWFLERYKMTFDEFLDKDGKAGPG